MSKAQDLLERFDLNEMAFQRQSFIDTLRDDYLKGAYGEFLCRQISLAVGEKDYWSNEVDRLMSKAKEMLTDKVKIHGFKDRKKAAKEALQDMQILLQAKVTYARNKTSTYFPDKAKRIQLLDISPEQEFINMLTEFGTEFLL